MAKKNKIRAENLVRLLIYILGYRPYEFGIVPDKDGFISCKKLIQAINEEDGWKHVRQGNINETLLGKNSTLFNSKGCLIRTGERHWELNLVNHCYFPPKILHIGIRRKGHSFVMEKGLRRIGDKLYTLSKDRDMAEKIGKRRDHTPVILQIRAEMASSGGLRFYRFGDLFLTREIPAKYITGPPVPKDIIKSKKEKTARKQKTIPDLEPGTFILIPEQDIMRSKTKKNKDWKDVKEKGRNGRKVKYK